MWACSAGPATGSRRAARPTRGAQLMPIPRASAPPPGAPRAVPAAIAALTLVLAFLHPLPAHALDPSRRLADYTRDVWTMAHGLPHEGIAAILQTRDGYLWVATLDGVARFDGVRFEVFNLIRDAGMETNVVVALAEAPDGALWMGTRDGLVRYQAGRYTVLGTGDGLSSAAIRCLLVDGDGALWVGTRWGGLNRIKDGQVTQFPRSAGLLHDDVRSLTADPSGGVWVGTAAGLNFVRGGTVTTVPLATDTTAPLVSALHMDRRGTLWIGTNATLLEVPGATAHRQAGRPLPATRRYEGTEVRAFYEDVADSLWVGLGWGLARIRGERLEVATERDRLSHHHVRALTVDREGSLWIGTDGGGLNRWRDTSIVLLPDEGLAMSLLAVHRATDGAMWVGGNCGGATRWRDGVVTRVRTADGLPSDCVQSLASEPSGAVWIGTIGGVARWQQGRVTQVYTTANVLPHNQVMSVAVGRRGDLWFGTGSGGVVHVDQGSRTVYDTTNGLGHPDVRAIVEARDGSVWIGTLGGGVTRWKDGALTTITKRDGLSSNHVVTITEDPDGTLWVGTNGGGLNRLREGTIAHFTSANGLPSDSVFRVLDDGRGALWMSSHRGVFSVTRQQLEDVALGRASRLTPRWFSSPDGLPGGGALGGTQPAGDRDPDGRLWFPTLRGPAVLDPEHLVHNAVTPPVHVERVRVDGLTVTGDALRALGPGIRDIEIDYTALSLVAPSQVRFRYLLEGYGEAWVDSGARRTAYFANLPPGAYRFRVMASNNDGVWNEQGAEIAFELRPHFYQTSVFWGACAVAIVGLAWAGVRARERRLHARQEELAREVEQAIAQVKVLSGLLPICASCKRIRDSKAPGETWRPLESYIQEHSQADFTHGICPECMHKLYPDV